MNAVLAGNLQLPKLDATAGVYRPGWLGNVLVGGVAGVVFWAMYGPMASLPLFGPASMDTPGAVLRVSELFGAMLTGIGGGRLLTAEIDKKLLSKETQALNQTKNTLVDTVRDLTRGKDR